jgi:hypothetical protein
MYKAKDLQVEYNLQLRLEYNHPLYSSFLYLDCEPTIDRTLKKLGSSLLATELESLQQPLELRLRLADHLRVHLQAAHGV